MNLPVACQNRCIKACHWTRPSDGLQLVRHLVTEVVCIPPAELSKMLFQGLQTSGRGTAVPLYRFATRRQIADDCDGMEKLQPAPFGLLGWCSSLIKLSASSAMFQDKSRPHVDAAMRSSPTLLLTDSGMALLPCAQEHAGPHSQTKKHLQAYHILVWNWCVGLVSRAIVPMRTICHGTLPQSHLAQFIVLSYLLIFALPCTQEIVKDHDAPFACDLE